MKSASTPRLITPGVIHVLATRRHIRPSARAGTLRLYDKRAVAMVRHELNAIDARRCRSIAEEAPPCRD